MHTCPALPTNVHWYIRNPKCPNVVFGQYGMSQCLVHCTMQCAQSHVSIPSRCTIGKGWDRMGCHTMYHAVCPIPCVHPVPLYHWEGMGPNGMSHHVPCSVPNPMCPSRPIVPLGGDGTKWDVPPCTMQCAQSHVSIQSHCTIGKGWDRMGCPTMYHAVCPIPCVHPVPLYHWEGMGLVGMSRNVPCSVPNPMCPFCPVVPLGGNGNGWDVSQCPMQSKNGTE